MSINPRRQYEAQTEQNGTVGLETMIDDGMKFRMDKKCTTRGERCVGLRGAFFVVGANFGAPRLAEKVGDA